MNEIIPKTLVGSAGFVASLGLAQFSEVVSLLVGIATLVYMITSIIKTYKSMDE